jgi:GH43 family beta-xylosidase
MCDDVNLWSKNLNNFKRNTNVYVVNMEFGLHIKTDKLGTSP